MTNKAEIWREALIEQRRVFSEYPLATLHTIRTHTCDVSISHIVIESQSNRFVSVIQWVIAAASWTTSAVVRDRHLEVFSKVAVTLQQRVRECPETKHRKTRFIRAIRRSAANGAYAWTSMALRSQTIPYRIQRKRARKSIAECPFQRT